jgi:hypothetical protein
MSKKSLKSYTNTQPEVGTVSKAQSRAKFVEFLNKARLEVNLEPGSDEFDFCISLTRHMAVVYSEFARDTEPRLAVKLLGNRFKRGAGTRTLCLWNTRSEKWVPLPMTKIFDSNVRTSKKKRVQAACRTAIKGQIDYVRNSTEVPFTCPISGKLITNKENCDVDHYGTNNFQRLLEQWMNLHGLNYETINLDRKGDLKDSDVFKSWYEFHAQNSTLKLADSSANRRKGARGW